MQTRPYKISPLFLAGLSLLTVGLSFSEEINTLYNTVKEPKNLSKYSTQIVEKCLNDTYRPACYDEEIPKLMDYISMEDSFKVTALVQQDDGAYQYCHVLGHELSAREVDKDPSKWKEVASRCPSGICSNGCTHGAFQEKFRTDSFDSDEEIQKIKPDLASVCEKRGTWNPTGLEQASCYHALGHLAMYITNADLYKANNLCKEIAVKADGRNYFQVCSDGAFMQIYQPLEPEDLALIEGKQPKKDEVPSFCKKFEKLEQISCFSESWPLFAQEIKKPDGLAKFCAMNPASSDRCFDGMAYVLTVQFNFDAEKIIDFCFGLPEERRGKCFGSAATRMIETDYKNIEKSIGLCKTAEPFDKKSDCFGELAKYSTFNFHSGSEPFFRLCSGLPDGWRKRCLLGKNNNI